MGEVFYVASKVGWTFIQPGSWLVFLVLIATLALWRNKQRLALAAMSILLVFSVAISLVPIGNFLLRPLETRFLNNPKLADVDGIIVLGGAEQAKLSQYWGQPHVIGSAERLLAAMALARRFPKAKLVYTGGSGALFNKTNKESAVAKQIFLNQGIDPKQIVVESNSRNTLENAIYTQALVKPTAKQHWVLVTSAYHMPRSIGIFCKIGWKVQPYPVDYRSRAFRFRLGWHFTRNLHHLDKAVREWVGLLAYWLTGKTSQLLPQGC